VWVDHCGDATCLVLSLLNAEVVIKAGTGKGRITLNSHNQSTQSKVSQTWFHASIKASISKSKDLGMPSMSEIRLSYEVCKTKLAKDSCACRWVKEGMQALTSTFVCNNKTMIGRRGAKERKEDGRRENRQWDRKWERQKQKCVHPQVSW
jgi:hypothetical protein